MGQGFREVMDRPRLDLTFIILVEHIAHQHVGISYSHFTEKAEAQSGQGFA